MNPWESNGGTMAMLRIHPLVRLYGIQERQNEWAPSGVIKRGNGTSPIALRFLRIS